MAGDGTGDDDDVHARVKYKGVARTADGRWRGFITNKFGRRYGVGDHGTPEEAALAHDRAILAILGAHASPAALNFRAAFSDTELRDMREVSIGHPTIDGVRNQWATRWGLRTKVGAEGTDRRWRGAKVLGGMRFRCSVSLSMMLTDQQVHRTNMYYMA
ncbi:hypothetical protein OsJ_31464 [Oryza sativa Japonica Group]|uniref:AP2/ERF domain-containing protein n=1 Tax=Oryza sativa subsp. japonica TaxID=39947 RepID=B9G5N3_ORYSJ|nr:hypothetical protein OsJ_31464 [Oryza sativa Japonica Group]